MGFLRRRVQMPGPQRTIIGQWQRALLLGQQNLVNQIVECVDPLVWDRDAAGVVEAMFEITVLRYFKPLLYEHQLNQFLIEVQDRYPDQRVPSGADIEVVIRAALDEPGLALEQIDSVRRLAIHAVVVDLVVHKLSMTESAIDNLILEGERTAFERGWKPALVER